MKLNIIVIVLLLITTSSVSISSMNTNNYIYVDGENIIGPWDGSQDHPFQYIQDGIDISQDDDTIYICNGVYHENIIINKSITLIGERNTTIDGMYNNDVLSVISDDVIIDNFIIKNSCRGIHLGSKNNFIKNCIIYRTKTGIYINQSSNNKIKNCTIYNNGKGIFLSSSNSNNIIENVFYYNSIGIHVKDSFDNKIQYSYLHANGIACFFEDSSYITIYHSNISDNSDNHGGIIIRNCSKITIDDSILRHNGMGVNSIHSKNIYITNCDIVYNTHFAVYSEKSSLYIFNCEISNNLRYGIYVIKDSYSIIYNNNIEGNMLYGIYNKKSACFAQDNWWGSFLGPSYLPFRKTTRITIFLQIIIHPYKHRSIKNIGASWKYNNEHMNIMFDVVTEKIDLLGSDEDNDGVPDWWEVKYGYNPNDWDDHDNIDDDKDGLNNREECYTDSFGSSPFQKDIFLEIDWMNNINKPSNILINEVINIFKEHDIILHVDIDNTSIPYVCNFSFADLQDLYWNYFLENDLNNPRKGIYHYALICDYGPDVNFPFVGWNYLDSMLISAQWMEDILSYNRERLIVGGIVHQLGTSLGLLAETHNGNDNIESMKLFTVQWFKYRNYKSCMNYYYKYRLLSYSDGTHGYGDFDDWKNLDLTFFKILIHL